MPAARAEAELQEMLAAANCEPFYAAGRLADERAGAYVGWTALKGSFADPMPLVGRGEVTLVFSGEEYCDAETARGDDGRPHSSRAAKASYLAQRYEEDRTFPAGLNGLFHGLVLDGKRGAAVLFNDRYGMHRLYCYESKEAFYFAAEAKSILAVRSELRTGDSRSLGEFVALGCVLENRTVFKGLRLLPQASAWVFRNGVIEKRRTYFHPSEWQEQGGLEPEQYYAELRESLARSLPRYFNGDQRIGIALTGGFDTRLIMAQRKPAEGELPCYTFGGTIRECEDVRIARRIAAACGQTHQVITVGDEYLSRFPHYASRSIYLTEGCVDVSRSSDLYVSEKAREIAPVKIVGTYGSELIRQAVMFKPNAPASGMYDPAFAQQIEEASDTYMGFRREHPVTFAAFRQSPWYHYGILALEQSQLTVRSPYLDDDVVRTLFRAPATGIETDLRLRLLRDWNPELSRIRTDRGMAGCSGPLTAAATRRLLDFVSRAEYAYDYGMPQWLAQADRLVSPLHMERLFLGRQKFLHFRIWYRGRLAEYVRQVLLDPATLSRPYLVRKRVEAVVEGHLKGGRNHTTEIHKLLTLELLHRLFIDAA